MAGRDPSRDGAATAAAEPAAAGRWSDEAALSLRILATSADCIKILDLDGRLSYMNASGQCLMEVDDFAALGGTPWPQAWPEASRSEIEAAIAAALSGHSSRFSGFCPTAKGTPKWWDVVVSPFRDGDGTLKWILAISRDVTAQKIAEQRLVESEQRFRALADHMAQLAWMADGSGSIFWYNRRWFDFTGTTLDEMRGWGWQKVHHPDHVDRVVKKISACFARGEVWEDIFPLRGANGEYRWFLSNARPILDDAGRVVLWCGTNTDITEQRSASARLRQMARLVELSHEAILVWDLERGIVLWNEGCESLYGYGRVEAVGRRSHDLLRTSHGRPVEDFERHLAEHGEWAGELLHITKDGREVWVDSRQELIRFGDRSVVLETNRDITDRRRADQTRNVLVAELNHRVKNTLAIVQSIAGQTARTTPDPRRFATAFNERLQALAAAHNMLTEANWLGADFDELLQRQVADWQGAPGNISRQGPKVFVGAQTALQLSLVVHELASNARKHGALSVPGGKVSIVWHVEAATPRVLHVNWSESGGPPVSPPARNGFGLTLIGRAGGQPNLDVQIAFAPSGFTCTIRTELPEPAPDEPAYFDPASGTGGRFQTVPATGEDKGAAPTRARQPRILVVEDEPLIAMEIEGIVADAGYVPVGPAASVEQAMAAIDELKFDAVVLDGNLFGEPVDRIVEALVARRVPFAFVSGTDRQRLAPALDRVPFVKKPIRPQELTEALHTITGAATPSR